MIRDTRFLLDDQREIVDKVISTNAYFCHHENLLLAMLADSRRHVCELASRRILKSREGKLQSSSEMRVFKVQKVNFNATDYIDLIDWSRLDITDCEPPVTSGYSAEDLRVIVEEGLKEKFLFSRLPCHKQAVERTVKLVTEAASSVCGHEKRDGYIRSKLLSREKKPSFETKKEYKF